MAKRDQYVGEFAKRLRDLIKHNWDSYREAAVALDIPESTLTRCARGEGEPSAGLVLTLSSKLDVSVSYLLGLDDELTPARQPRSKRKPEIDRIAVPSLDVRAAAGGGAINHVMKAEETREFPLWMLQALTKTARGKPSSLRLMRAIGDSMEPLIRSGALLLIDESARDHHHSPKRQTQWDHPDVYVFLQDDELRVKRLRVDRKGFTIALSENAAYDPEILQKQDFKVLGRVIWWDNRL
jgi:SOS-response transcriptional repressor LexA